MLEVEQEPSARAVALALSVRVVGRVPSVRAAGVPSSVWAAWEELVPSHQAQQQVALAEASPSAWRPLLAQFLAQVQQPHPAATHSAEVGPSSVPTALPSAVQLPLVVLVCSPSGELRSSAQ